MKSAAAGLAATLALLVVGCASGGPDDGLGTRKLSWFSYLNADDLRIGCVAGTPERLRLVYNADYAEHVRTYDLAIDSKTGGAELNIRALPAANAADMASDNLTGPWRGTRTTVSLSPGQSTGLLNKIAESGAFGPPPVGLSLPSGDIYWLVSGCHQGHAFVTATRIPTADAPQPAYAAALAALDNTGVPFPDLANRNRHIARTPPRHSQDSALTFTIRIGEQGLWGTLVF